MGERAGRFPEKNVIFFSVVSCGLSATDIGYKWDFSIYWRRPKKPVCGILSSFYLLSQNIINNLYQSMPNFKKVPPTPRQPESFLFSQQCFCGPGVLWSSDYPQVGIWWRGEELTPSLEPSAPMGRRKRTRAAHAQWLPFSLRPSSVTTPGVQPNAAWLVRWDASTLNLPGCPPECSGLWWDCYWLFLINIRVEECLCRCFGLLQEAHPQAA